MNPAQFWALEMQNQQNQQAQQMANQKLVLDGLSQLGGALQEQGQAKRGFEANFDFLTKRNMLDAQTQEAAASLAQRGDFAGASATISPYLAELDFGRKAMLSGRSGFFDASGQWQMAMPAQEVQPRNKYGYRVGGGR